MYTSDKWLVIKIGKAYKVFATIYGGYLDGGSWRLNSGITKVDYKDGYYYFHGASGSIYKCNEDMYGVAGVENMGMLTQFLQAGGTQMREDTDWLEVEYA